MDVSPKIMAAQHASLATRSAPATQGETMRQASAASLRAAEDLESKLQSLASKLFGRGFACGSLEGEPSDVGGLFEDVTNGAQMSVTTLSRCAEIVDDMLERV